MIIFNTIWQHLLETLYMVGSSCVLAIVFGAVGMGKNSSKQSMAKAGLICGVSALAWQFVLDLLLTIFSFGMGGVSFCC